MVELDVHTNPFASAESNEYKQSVTSPNSMPRVSRGPPPSMTVRARRRREEAVRRLVADVQQQHPKGSLDAAALQETHDWLVASTVATALEKGLDRELHTELVSEAKENASRISQICHDHADVFLDSVAQVAALEEPSALLSQGLEQAQRNLEEYTAGPMVQAATQWQDAQQSYHKANSLNQVVLACQNAAIQLERARKQATLGRPKEALQAVDAARQALSTPLQPLSTSSGLNATAVSGTRTGDGTNGHALTGTNGDAADATAVSNVASKAALQTLEQTPFGKRALQILPKIETEVLNGARRGLNRWFLSMRSGNGNKAGKAVLRQTATAWAVGPGQLSLGGHLPPSFLWRAKAADNLMSRVDQKNKLSRAARQGYWFDRDAPQEANRILGLASQEGVARQAEALAAAFGWYRCWEPDVELLVDPAEYLEAFEGKGPALSGSRHGSGLSGSRHGLGGSKHGGLRNSKHGRRTLGFRATTHSRSQAFAEISSGLGSAAAGSSSVSRASRWAEVLWPTLLTEASPPSQAEEYQIFVSLPESVHPVRRAEMAFSLLGRQDEFVAYYEQNRFGETTIGDGKDGEKRSYLSSLTGDDVSLGNERLFYNKSLPNLCASIIGFSAVEAAIEMGNFDDEELEFKTEDANSSDAPTAAAAVKNPTSTLNAARFRESSERYERSLENELGNLLKARAKRSYLCELVRASHMLAIMRASLKIAHPTSTTRRHDRELLLMDSDVLKIATKIAQDEQVKCTSAICLDDRKTPMLVADSYSSMKGPVIKNKSVTGIPDPEEVGLPFGLGQMKQIPQAANLDFQDEYSRNRAPMDESYTFSPSVPVVIRSLHARVIACAAFALSQEELGQKFPTKKGSDAAGFVLDCLEVCTQSAAVGLKDSENTVDEGSVDKAVQVMANIAALQHCLPRLFGTILRGMCHIGLIRADEIEETFSYAERALKSADKSCDAQVGSTYSLVYEICRNKIDSHINYALENFNWIAKSERDMPNAYCEGLISYLRSVFASLGPMDEGSRAGLHFSCCGHVSERLVKLLSGKPGDTATFDDSGLPPIARIDAFGIKNLATDCEELERFADTTGVPQLRDCFSELRILTNVMLDKELPMLLMPENVGQRRRKYPILSIEKVANILEKYVGTGLGDKLMGGARGKSEILFIDKKEVQQLVKIARSQC